MRIRPPTACDIGFPTPRALSSSDAPHGAPDYSAVQVVLRTDADEALEGHGLTFIRGPLRHPAF
jgi:L-fuconate dehydratase